MIGNISPGIHLTQEAVTERVHDKIRNGKCIIFG